MIQDNNQQIFISLERYQTPKITENKSKGIVYFGEENMFPDKLVDLYNESPTHNAIINGKVGYIVGDGLTFESEDINRSANAKQWLTRANDSETWTELLKKIATDYEINNGFCIEVLRTSEGNKYYHVDFSRIRVGTEGELVYSANWSKDGKRNYRPTTEIIPKYAEYRTDKRSLIYYSEYRPNMDVYPLPVYMGSLAAIETDVEINNYWINEIKNGFSGGTLLTFNNGIPQNSDKQKEIERKFKQKYTGSENAGQLVINFAADKEHAPTLESLNGNDLPARYEQLATTVQQNIFIGHRVTSPMLFGVKTEGQLGGRGEISVAYEIFKKTYISERQQTLLRIVNRRMIEDIGFGGVTINQFEPVENTLELSEATIVANLRPDEIRELISRQTGMELKANFHKFSEEDAELEFAKRFEKVGTSKDKFDELLELDIDFSASGEPMEFANDLQDLDVKILKLVESNSKMSMGEIAKALSVSILEVNKRVGALQSANRIVKDGLNWGLLQAGKNALKILNLPATKEKLSIRYKYDLRSDALPLKGGKSRTFCRAMMSIDKLWTREEIDFIRNDMKTSGFAPQVTDVWLSRGGWYRPPFTDISVPFCRHIWKQVIVKEKK